jgi:hypothetical protein
MSMQYALYTPAEPPKTSLGVKIIKGAAIGLGIAIFAFEWTVALAPPDWYLTVLETLQNQAV